MILWQVLLIILDVEMIAILVALFFISILYSSVGHGGASGYLAILSLTTFATMSDIWLKQHAWMLNLIVAAIAFYHYNKQGYHDFSLTKPFIIASIPMALIAGTMKINGDIYDILLSLTLIWAAVKIITFQNSVVAKITSPTSKQAFVWGGGIGFFSGIIGVGGGIFLSPVLLLKKWADVKTAAATAAVFIFLNSLAGLTGNLITGQNELDVSILFSFATVVLIGGFIGSLYGSRFASQKHVRTLLVIVLFVAAIKRVSDFFGF